MSRQSELAELSRIYDSSALTNRNVVINGAMQVAQRGTSQTSISSQGYYTVDRFEIQMSSAGRFTMTQESDGPDGFPNSIKLACTTADTSIGSGEILTLRTVLESQDLQRFKKGTSAAEKMTLSFYVKGNAAATYMAELEDRDNSRNNTVKFNVTTDWTRVSITFNADTTGAFDDDNAEGLRINFWLHAGSTYNSGTYTENTWASSVSANKAVGIDSFFDSTSRTFFITGVQLEVGDTATPFEHRSFGDELQRCQRYYAQGGIILSDTTPDRYHNVINLPCEMRAQPTVSSGGIDSGSGGTMVSVWDSSNSSTSKRNFYQGANNSVISNSWFAFDAEL